MSRWNVAGEFFIPKGITLYWYRPFGVAKAEISFVRSVKGICQNPFNKSNLETYLALPTLSTQSSIRGMGPGNVSVFVKLLTFR